MPGWRILTHPTGPWIIHTDAGRVLVPAVLGRRLAALEGRRPSRAEVLRSLRAGTPLGEDRLNHRLADLLLGTAAPHRSRSRQRPALWLRFPLLSARWTERLARPLQPLTSGPRLAVLAAGIILLVWSVVAARPGPWALGADSVPGIALFLIGGLCHELAHAAALAAQGYPAGGIGGGLLFVLPVLHNDVSAVTLLPRAGRLRVDLAGVVLQGCFGAVLGLAGWWVGWGAGTLAAQLTLVAVIWSLLPFIHSDGYHALGDLVGSPGLDAPLPPGCSARACLAGAFYKLGNLGFLVLVTGLLPWRWLGGLRGLAGDGAWWPYLLPVGLWIMMVPRLRNLVTGLVADGRRAGFSGSAGKGRGSPS
ncbi:hypothetical protein CSA17_00485 [bacterium DOLJORAL78_65_58]|nr:MAG: hypothetical protein CSA17_00485 [bacterium DOLJORAL78_65_58]